MEHVSAKDILGMEKTYRRNLIHCCTGYKSANLVATQSSEGKPYVAVINSIFHMGSNPPMLGFILRPQTIPKKIYKNILETGYFTVNHIHKDMIEQAHQMADNINSENSGFTPTGFEKELLEEFPAPYVKQSALKLGCKYLEKYHIKENNTEIFVAGIEHIYYEAGIQMPDGWLRLDDAGPGTVTLNGLDGYSLPSLLDRFRYAKPGQEITSFFKTVKT